ncbi:MAG: hypothetical protein U0R50_14095 [Gaiellales bacterium]
MTALEHETTSTTERSEWAASELRRVVLRLADGELVQAGTAPNLDGAKSLAQSLIREIDHPTGEWPRIGDRHIRPDAVISVDVLRVVA